MALPELRPLTYDQLQCHSPSVGASAVNAYVRAPYRARVLKLWSILAGTITSADSTVTVAVNGTTIGTITIAASGAAAGVYDESDPTAETYVAEGDVISFAPSGASGASIPATFGAAIQRA